MRIYDQINAPAPKDIDKKRAHIIGGGIAGLSAAIALVTDAHMPAGNVTIYESLPDVGGSMDGAGDSERGTRVAASANSKRAWSASGTSAAKFPP
jgi:oleate hydratase